MIVTPHVAFYSSEATEELRTRVARQVVAYLRGETPENVVNPGVLSAYSSMALCICHSPCASRRG